MVSPQYTRSFSLSHDLPLSLRGEVGILIIFNPFPPNGGLGGLLLFRRTPHVLAYHAPLYVPPHPGGFAPVYPFFLSVW